MVKPLPPWAGHLQPVFPADMLEGLSYYEELCKILFKLDEVIQQVNTNEQNISTFEKNMTDKYNELLAVWKATQDWITNWFNDIDVDAEFYKLWQKVVDSGEALAVMEPYIDSQIALKWNAFLTDYNTFKTQLTGEWTAYKNTMDGNYSSFTTTITNRLAAFEKSVNDTVQEIQSSLNDFIGQTNTNISNINTQIASAKTDISALQTAVSANTGDISVLKTDMSTAKTQIGGLQSTVSAHTLSITNINSELNSQDDRITTLEDTTGDNSSAISTLQTSIGTINSTLTTMQQNINVMQSSINSLQGTVNGLSTTVSGHSTAIADLQRITNSLETTTNHIMDLIGDTDTDISNLQTAVNTINATLAAKPGLRVFSNLTNLKASTDLKDNEIVIVYKNFIPRLWYCSTTPTSTGQLWLSTNSHDTGGSGNIYATPSSRVFYTFDMLTSDILSLTGAAEFYDSIIINDYITDSSSQKAYYITLSGSFHAHLIEGQYAGRNKLKIDINEYQGTFNLLKNTFKNLDLNFANGSNAAIINGAEFIDCAISFTTATQFRNCRFTNCIILDNIGSSWVGCVFINCTFSGFGTASYQSVYSQCFFKVCNFLITNQSDVLQTCVYDKCAFNLNSVNGNIKGEFYHCSFTNNTGNVNQPFTSSKLYRCSYTNTANTTFSFNACEVTDFFTSNNNISGRSYNRCILMLLGSAAITVGYMTSNSVSNCVIIHSPTLTLSLTGQNNTIIPPTS